MKNGQSKVHGVHLLIPSLYIMPDIFVYCVVNRCVSLRLKYG